MDRRACFICPAYSLWRSSPLIAFLADIVDRPVTGLILKRASASRPSGQWNDHDYDVLADGFVVGRIFQANAAPVGEPWMWTLAFDFRGGRTPTHGYAATREAAMAAFAKSWRRE